MKASSESGLWALTISRGVTEVIAGLANLQCSTPQVATLLRQKEMGKGGQSLGLRTPKPSLAIIRFAHYAPCPNHSGSVNPTVRLLRYCVIRSPRKVALYVIRFYMSPPAN